jgi:carbamate kinase
MQGFGSAEEDPIGQLTPSEAETLLPELAEGSMQPKVEAALQFVRATKGEVLITSAAALAGALEGRTGTRLRP